MKYAYILLFILHGLIHVIGFAKAFQLAEVKQISQAISRLDGSLWLLTTVLCGLTAILIIFKSNYWWSLGIIAIFLSQYLIISCWKDAKFGTIINVVLLIPVLIGYFSFAYENYYRKEVNFLLSTSIPNQQDLLEESDIEHLPDAIKRYIRYTGSIGKPKVQNFSIHFSGKIRRNEESEWMPFMSEQNNFMASPARLFFMKARMKGLPVYGYHCYKNGKAFMDIRLFSLFKVQYMDGHDMDVAETVTFFNDMCCMAPATLIDPRISWKETGPQSVHAVFKNNAIAISAELLFNEKGELINFISGDRFNAEAGSKMPWSTPLKNYKNYNGYRLASYADAVYTYPENEMTYGNFELVGIQYNLR